MSIDLQAPAERWLPIPEYEGFYEVSDHGRVRSVDRMCRHSRGGMRRLKGKLRKLVVLSTGYLQVSLSRGGVIRRELVHRLVLLAFVGEPPAGHEGCHEDNDPANCRLDNLRWDTHKGNCADRARHGTVLRGENHPRAKLTAQAAKAIRARLANGEPQRSVARAFGVSQPTIGRVGEGTAYSGAENYE